MSTSTRRWSRLGTRGEWTVEGLREENRIWFEKVRLSLTSRQRKRLRNLYRRGWMRVPEVLARVLARIDGVETKVAHTKAGNLEFVHADVVQAALTLGDMIGPRPSIRETYERILKKRLTYLSQYGGGKSALQAVFQNSAAFQNVQVSVDPADPTMFNVTAEVPVVADFVSLRFTLEDT
jgi:hypothetical protein